MQEIKTRERRQLDEALKLLGLLESHGYQARLVGGCVRDRQQGMTPKDYDIATDAKPEEVSVIFGQKNLRIIPTGIDHGTISVLTKNGSFEVTTLREDRQTDGRHAVVVFGNSFADDAARRDFTINALSEDRRGQVYDYYQGLKDLKDRRLRFVGDPVHRIREDYLRIPRFFRFWARFALTPDPRALEAISEEWSGLAVVSQERITSELMLLLEEDDPLPALRAMIETNSWRAILPEMNPKAITDASPFYAQQIIKKTKRDICRLYLILPRGLTKGEAKAIGSRLKLSNSASKKLQTLFWGEAQLPLLKSEKSALMQFLDGCEDGWGDDPFMEEAMPTWSSLLTHQRDALKKLYDLEMWEKSLRKASLPISGDILIRECQIPVGPQVGEVLSSLKRAYRDGKWGDVASGLELARKLIISKE